MKKLFFIICLVLSLCSCDSTYYLDRTYYPIYNPSIVYYPSVNRVTIYRSIPVRPHVHHSSRGNRGGRR